MIVFKSLTERQGKKFINCKMYILCKRVEKKPKNSDKIISHYVHHFSHATISSVNPAGLEKSTKLVMTLWIFLNPADPAGWVKKFVGVYKFDYSPSPHLASWEENQVGKKGMGKGKGKWKGRTEKERVKGGKD